MTELRFLVDYGSLNLIAFPKPSVSYQTFSRCKIYDYKNSIDYYIIF